MTHKITLALFQKTTFVGVCSLFLAACGGGSSNSGGPVAPPPPSFTFYNAGQYSGTIQFNFVGENIVDTNDEPTFFSPRVTGTVAGNQQIGIRFTRFGGTSAIGLNGGFSIPSGLFNLNVISTSSGEILTRCEGEYLFEGTFSNATSLSGNVTTTTPFVCEDSGFGPVTASGPFEANFGSAKQRTLNATPGIYSVDF